MAGQEGNLDAVLAGALLDLGETLDRRIGEQAVARGWLTPERLDEALRVRRPGPAGHYLINAGLLAAERVDELISGLSPTMRSTFPPVAGPDPSLPPEVSKALGDRNNVFGRYVMVNEIGRGAMGSVWRAWDTGLARWVAVKGLRDDTSEEFRSRFLREVRAAARLRHPNLVTVYDAGEIEKRPYLAMELIDGKPLDVKGPLRGTVELLRKVALGLGEAHRRGIVHRDLKPGNIVVDVAGEPRIVDFGLAMLVSGTEERLTRTGAAMGTPMYMAPEQAAARKEAIGPATDIYALGVILYEAMTGKFPHDAETPVQILSKILSEDVKPPRSVASKVPRDLETICLRALEKEPGDRYATAEALAEDLGHWLAGEPIQARPVSLVTTLWRRGLRYRRALLPAAIALVVVGGALAKTVQVLRRDRARTEALKLVEIARPGIASAGSALYRGDAELTEPRRVLQRSRETLEQAVALCPDLALAYGELGRACDLQGDEAAAEAALRRAIDIDPGSGPAHYRLGRLLIQRSFDVGVIVHYYRKDREEQLSARRASEAAKHFDLAMKVGSGFDDELARELVRAMTAVLRKDAETLISIYKEAPARFGRAEGVEQFSYLYANICPGEMGDRLLDEALKLRPGFPWALVSRALRHHKAGNDPAALRDCDEALRIQPGFFEAIYTRGNLHYELKDHAAAEADFTTLIAVQPDFEDLWFNRGNARRALKKWKDAMADYDQSIVLEPTHDAPYLYRAGCRLALGDRKGAIADYDKVLELSPGRGDAAVYRACMLIEDGRGAEVAEELRRLLDLPTLLEDLRAFGKRYLEQFEKSRKEY